MTEDVSRAVPPSPSGDQEPPADMPPLRALAGAALPADLSKDADHLAKLSDEALRNFGRVLTPTVLLPLSGELGELLARFCREHRIAEADLGRVLKVCRWLLREASALDLPIEDLRADIEAIWSEPRALSETLQQEYEPLKRALREQLLADALLKHGNVLIDVDWRLDQVTSDRHAAKLGTSVALVTLAYRDAERDRRLTLQLTPNKLDRLAQIFTALAQKTRLAAD